MDMSAAYEKAVRDTLPNAKIVFGHFHIAKLANEALNEVRRALMREAADKEAKAQTKGTMWATLHRMDNATDQHHEVLARLRPEQPLGRAFLLKESLLDIRRHAVAKPQEALQGGSRGPRARGSSLSSGWAPGRTIRDHLGVVVALLQERVANTKLALLDDAGRTTPRGQVTNLRARRPAAHHGARSHCCLGSMGSPISATEKLPPLESTRSGR